MRSRRVISGQLFFQSNFLGQSGSLEVVIAKKWVKFGHNTFITIYEEVFELSYFLHISLIRFDRDVGKSS